MADRDGVASDRLDDGLQVVEQEVLEPEPLVVVEIGPSEHRADVRVEVGDCRGERLVLQEHRRRRLEELGRRCRGDALGTELGERGEAVGDGGEQLARDLARAPGGAEHLLDLAVHPHAERGRRVAGGLALVLGDRRDANLPGTGEQVAVLLEVAQPLLDHLYRQVDAALGDIVGRPLGEQRPGEQPHDRHVVADSWAVAYAYSRSRSASAMGDPMPPFCRGGVTKYKRVAGAVGVEVVDVGQNLRCLGLAGVVGERGDIEIVADLVALHHKVRLDAQRLRQRRYARLSHHSAASTSTTSSGRVRRSWRRPASMPPSEPQDRASAATARPDTGRPSPRSLRTPRGSSSYRSVEVRAARGRGRTTSPWPA